MAGSTTYYYAAGNLSFTNATAGGSGLTILGMVYLYVPEGTTLTCIGANASGQTGGGAASNIGTGVAAARAAAGLAAKYYDLQGRRLSQPSRAGVYINNGVVKVNK